MRSKFQSMNKIYCFVTKFHTIHNVFMLQILQHYYSTEAILFRQPVRYMIEVDHGLLIFESLKVEPVVQVTRMTV